MAVDFIARAIATSKGEDSKEIEDLKEQVKELEKNFNNLNKIIEKNGGRLGYTPLVRFVLSKGL